MCGKVQCTNVDVNTPPPGAHVSIQIVEGSSCVNADFNLGTDVLDPAYVNPGSLCDKGKVSLLFRMKASKNEKVNKVNHSDCVSKLCLLCRPAWTFSVSMLLLCCPTWTVTLRPPAMAEG